MARRPSFWMVYGLHQGAPTVRHKTEASAVAEAQRLARSHGGVEFFVLEASHRVVKNEVIVEPLGDRYPSDPYDDGIPF